MKIEEIRLSYNPRCRHHLILTTQQPEDARSADMGREMAGRIEGHLDHPQLSLMAVDCFHQIVKEYMGADPVMGNYVVLTNVGILFEPPLGLNVHDLWETIARRSTLIISQAGSSVKGRTFYLTTACPPAYTTDLSDINHIALP